MTRTERLERNYVPYITDCYSVNDTTYYSYSLDMDDGMNLEATTLCRKYIEHWDEMERSHTGLLLYGNVGTGKTFLAKAMANEIKQRDTLVTVTSFPRILTALQTPSNRMGVISQIGESELIVIDDIGAERDSSYVDEQVLFLLDSLAERKRTLIVTTNLDPEKMQSTENMVHKRIYDRVLMCCPLRLKICGESRRRKQAENRATEAMRIITGETQ